MQNDEARMTNGELMLNDEVRSCGVTRHSIIRNSFVIRHLSFIVLS